jgi:predicted transcriptional regulator
MENRTEIIIYQTDDGLTKIETRLENETVWLTLEQMSELFQKSKSTINEHVLNIFKEGELIEEEVKRKIGNSDFSTKPIRKNSCRRRKNKPSTDVRKTQQEYDKYKEKIKNQLSKVEKILFDR